MKNRLPSGPAIAALVSAICLSLAAAGTMGAQSSSQTILGEWQADEPLPNGVVQTFRFGSDGKFELAMALSVEGSYRIDGNQLIETVTLPSLGVSHTDTATFQVGGDSLMVSERAASTPKVLRRARQSAATVPAASPATASPIAGDWTIAVGEGVEAHYVFTPDGTMHMHANVGDEEGSYVVNADTLHLSNDKTFQLPAIARFAVAGSVLTLTPANGKQPRSFHKVGAAQH